VEPLANQIRPQSLDEFVGQSHLAGPDKPIRLAIENRLVFSFLLWGTPGTGKTTLARIYANAINAEFHELSAVSAGKDDIRKIVNAPSFPDRPKVLFLDEIHRFNKAQQDFLLPYVESGDLVLIGATTENPSFEVIPALLSRLRVFVLEELNASNMSDIIDRTGFELDQPAKDWLIEMANGDARQAITMIENTSRLYDSSTITLSAPLLSRCVPAAPTPLFIISPE
jgi:putative ATPase